MELTFSEWDKRSRWNSILDFTVKMFTFVSIISKQNGVTVLLRSSLGERLWHFENVSFSFVHKASNVR